jgi:hypothetical protein
MTPLRRRMIEDIRRMDSLSVDIRVPSIDCDGETWTGVNTGPRNDLFFPNALLSARRRVAGIRLEWWPPSNRNSGRDQIGIPGRLALEFAAHGLVGPTFWYIERTVLFGGGRAIMSEIPRVWGLNSRLEQYLLTAVKIRA